MSNATTDAAFAVKVIAYVAQMAEQAIARNMVPVALVVGDENDRPALIAATSPSGMAMTGEELASILVVLLENLRRAPTTPKRSALSPCTCEGCARRRAEAEAAPMVVPMTNTVH